MKRVIREIKYIVSAAEDGLPLGRFLQRRGYSQQMLSDLKKEGLTVEGAFHRLIDPVRQGEEIGVAVFSEQNSLKVNPLLKAELIYEDEDYLVFNKPADMLVHPCARQFADALGNYFAALYPDLLFRPLGRLDRNTTGAVLVAKHRLAAGLVKNVKKQYTAVAEGQIEPSAGQIELPLVRVGGTVIRQEVSERGKYALTYYRVLKYLPAHSVVSLSLATGRTHQIRAHLAAIGHPLAGDSLYGGKKDLINRSALHCSRIEFDQPFLQTTVKVEAALAEDLLKIIK